MVLLARFATFVSSFAAMCAAYWLYAWLVVPLIEPAAQASSPVVQEDSAPGRRPYDDLFPEGSWERDMPKILATDQGALFIKEYRAIDDERLELKPCTLVFFASGGDGKRGRPVIMQAPDGAIVQFAAGADLSRAKLGRIVAARLMGEITIRSPESEPGRKDDLLIVTRNIQMDERRVWTPNDVQLRFGPNLARGSDMVITLNATGPKLGKMRDDVRNIGIQSLELVHLDLLELQIPAKGSPLGGTSFLSAFQPQKKLPPAGNEDATERLMPVKINCGGPFLIDLQKQVATFERDVEVVCQRVEGPGDQLDCQKLDLYFRLTNRTSETTASSPADSPAATEPAATEPAATEPAATEPANSTGTGFEPERIVAIGFPVTLRIPSLNASVRGNGLEYNLKTRRVRLIDKQGAARILQGQDTHIEAPEIDYQMAEPGRLGTLFSKGRGFLKVRSAEHGRTVEAHWGQGIAIRPDQDHKVISLFEDSRIAISDLGELSGDELHIWVSEIEKDGDSATATDSGGSPPLQRSAAGKVEIAPDRMLARGRVRMNSESFANESEELQVWFRRPATNANPQATRLTTTPKAGPQALALGNTNASRGSRASQQRGKFKLVGRLVQMEVESGDAGGVTQATIDGSVRFEQIEGNVDSSQPLSMVGDVFKYENGLSANPKASISGQPATVQARGLSLTGATIQLFQGDNYMLLDGNGQMRLPAGGRTLSAGVTAADKPVVVVWRDRMQFDGQTARFEGDVRTVGTFMLQSGQSMNIEATSQVLDVVLSRRIDFANPRAASDLTAQRFEFAGNVRLANEGISPSGERESIEEMRTPNLMIDQVTGEIRSEGAGRVWSVRRGGNAIGKMPLAQAAGAGRVQAGLANESDPQLNFLEVDYRRGIQGSLHQRDVHFLGDVHTIYCPVEDWNRRPDARTDTAPRDGKVPEDAIFLRCDDLAVRQMGQFRDPAQPANVRPAMELEARGNAEFRGQQFRALAGQIAYAEAKDLLVVQGDGFNDAILERFSQDSATPSQLRAEKIHYIPSTGAFDITGRGLRVPNLNSLRP